MDKYRDQLNSVVQQHTEMLENAQSTMADLIAKSNQEMLELATKLNTQLAAEQEPPKPEVAWVKDHLVLNPPAVDMFNRLFVVMQEVLPELAKIAKGR